MAEGKCSHPRRSSGILQSDLGRISEKPSTYSARFRVIICQDCGQIDFYCESPGVVCDWLEGAGVERKTK